MKPYYFKETAVSFIAGHRAAFSTRPDGKPKTSQRIENIRSSQMRSVRAFSDAERIKPVFAGSLFSAGAVDRLIDSIFIRHGADGVEKAAGLLSRDMLYDLAVRSSEGKNDELVPYLLSAMEIVQLDRYFSDSARSAAFIRGIGGISRSEAGRVLSKNPQLHGYYAFLVNTAGFSVEATAAQRETADLSGSEAAQHVADRLKHRFNLGSGLESYLP